MAKIAVCGKGGVGKTMLAALISHAIVGRGRRVIAVDADSNPTLGLALGFPANVVSSLQSIASLKPLIEERTGTMAEKAGAFFKLNPKVEDIPGTYAVSHGQIRLLEMGETQGANSGCACSENTFLKALFKHLAVKENESVVMDMPGGTEHFGRGTARAMDAILLVVEPGLRSLNTATRMMEMSRQMGVEHICCVANKISDSTDKDRVKNEISPVPIIEWVPWHPDVVASENRGESLYAASPFFVGIAERILNSVLDTNSKGQQSRAKSIC